MLVFLESILTIILIIFSITVIVLLSVLLYCKHSKKKNTENKSYHHEEINSNSLIVDYKIRMARERISNHSYVQQDNGEKLDIFDKLNYGINLVNNYDIDNICRRIY